MAQKNSKAAIAPASYQMPRFGFGPIRLGNADAIRQLLAHLAAEPEDPEAAALIAAGHVARRPAASAKRNVR